MRARTFPGGIHPPEHKYLSEKKPIERVKAPDVVVIPLSQHIGAPCKAIVKVGDNVKMGQMIGEARGFVSVPVHSSVSGKVKAIGPFNHPLGDVQPAITIENDGKDDAVEPPKPFDDIANADPKKLIERICELGVVGMGGAAFPTHVKLSPPKDKPIDTVILNGTECEPFLTADHRLMLEQPKRIINGFKVVAQVLGASRAIIGIEGNKPDAIKVMRDSLNGSGNIEVVELIVKYPQGGEKQLIKALLNREVPPPPGLPLHVGVVVQNVGTAAAIADAIFEGKPLIERVTTVTGSGIKEPKNLLVRVGTLASHLIRQCGGYNGEIGKFILGGPMMGIAQSTDRVPVCKGTSGVLVLTKEDTTIREPEPCIRCGRCLDACPIHLRPYHLGALVEQDRLEDAEGESVLDCIECGSCGYVCPAARWLVHLFKSAKAQIMARKRAS
ncbi:MAG: electron transport complex subunit RsxC [Candidatus Coatesbacteria bacterium]|nr:electron transport complex subunit RsxC [Candidatus Coatesbacteria bacterium]